MALSKFGENQNVLIVNELRYESRPDAYGCYGCVFTHASIQWCDLNGLCTPDDRDDLRSVIWIKAEEQEWALRNDLWKPHK